VTFFNERQQLVHVSVDAGITELLVLYQGGMPVFVVDVLVEARHLAEHARVALGHGVAHAVVQKNGDVIRLAPGEPRKIGEVRVGQLVLDGDVILPADGATVNERRRIGSGGLITVALPVGNDGKLAGTPLVRPFGVPVEEDRDDFIADATDAATRAFSPDADEDKMREAVRLAVRRCATLWTGKKPLVEVMLLQIA
jgi:ribonuclease J